MLQTVKHTAMTNKTSSLFFPVYLILLFFFNSCSQYVSLYVSPAGDDTNVGTKGQPLKSLEGARKAVRVALKEKSGTTVTVYLSGGLYSVTQPVMFDAEDSGSESSPVTYKAMKGETPVFSGSKTIDQWELVNADSLYDRLNASTRGKVFIADLPKNDILDFGDPSDAGKRPVLICNGELQVLARWPNEGFVASGKAVGKTVTPPNYMGTHGTREGVFEYIDSYQDRWAEETDIRLGGYWFWDWSEECHRVEKWDKASRTVHLKEPYHAYGYKDSLNYFGFNLFCELDQPGEWFLDREKGKLYWYPPEGIDPKSANVTLTYFSDPYMIELEDCSHVRFEGLTFMEGRGSAILIRDGESNLLSGCRVLRFGDDGIHIQNGRGHGVTGCYLSSFGHGGMKIKGGDRKTLEPAEHFVEHTVIEHFSLFKRTYQPAIHLEGCGIRVANNRFSHSSSSAMRLEGNDFIIEYNEIAHVVNESDDQGGLDMWNNPSYWGNVIRYNRWSDIRGGTNHGAAGVRLDDMISGVLVYGNLFERCGSLDFGGVQIHGGKDNIIDNNIFFQCPYGVSFTLWDKERWIARLDAPETKRKLYEEVDINSSLYRERYPRLQHLREETDVNSITNNLIIDAHDNFLRINDTQKVANNVSLKSEGKEPEAFCTREVTEKYGLQPIPVDAMGPKNNPWLK